MGSFFDSLKGAFGAVTSFAGDALNWTADVAQDIASIGDSFSGLLSSVKDPGALVLNATTPGLSPTYLSPSSPATVATSSNTTWLVLGGVVLVGGLLYLATR